MELDNLINDPINILRPPENEFFSILDREERQIMKLATIKRRMSYVINNVKGASIYGITFTHSPKNNFHNLKLRAQYDISVFGLRKCLKRKSVDYWGYPEYTCNGIIHWHLLVFGPALEIMKLVNSWKRNWGQCHTIHYPEIDKDIQIFNKVYSIERYYNYIIKDIEKWKKPALTNNFI